MNRQHWNNEEEVEYIDPSARTVEDWKKLDRNRDNYFRCKHCGQLWHHEQCILDNVKGYQCPSGCIEEFVQAPYESPFSE